MQDIWYVTSLGAMTHSFRQHLLLNRKPANSARLPGEQATKRCLFLPSSSAGATGVFGYA